MIDATTPFRKLGTVPVSAWMAMRDRLRSPLTDADLDDVCSGSDQVTCAFG